MAPLAVGLTRSRMTQSRHPARVMGTAVLGSVCLQTGILDWTFPACDLRNHIFGEVFRPTPLGGNADYADVVKSCPDRRRIHCRMGCLVELDHDVLRRAFWQEESRPSHDIDIDTLLVRRPKLGHERRALARQQRERLRLLCDGSRNRST